MITRWCRFYPADIRTAPYSTARTRFLPHNWCDIRLEFHCIYNVSDVRIRGFLISITLAQKTFFNAVPNRTVCSRIETCYKTWHENRNISSVFTPEAAPTFLDYKYYKTILLTARCFISVAYAKTDTRECLFSSHRVLFLRVQRRKCVKEFR